MTWARVVNRSNRTSQSGYVLIAVLGMLVLIGILLGAALSMTVTATKVTASFADSTARVSAADSALERTASGLRRDRDAAFKDCEGASAFGSAHPRAFRHSVGLANGTTVDVIVDCITVGAIGDARDIELRAFVGEASVAQGAARFVIVDRVDSVDRPGATLTVCDWQLHQRVRSALAPCA